MLNPIKLLFLVFSWAMAFGIGTSVFEIYQALRVETVKAHQIGPMSLKKWNDKLMGK